MNTAQMNLFEYVASLDIPEPKLNIGQTVFIRELDFVRTAQITELWLCNSSTLSENQNQYYGYRIAFDDGGHDSIWDYCIGDTVFLNKESADLTVGSLRYEKIDPAAIELEEFRAFEYVRKCDNYLLTAGIAKINELQLFEHDFMCYHFIRTYPNQKRRDAEYAKLLKKIIEESEDSAGKEAENHQFEELYKVGDIYASRGYALHHLAYRRVTAIM